MKLLTRTLGAPRGGLNTRDSVFDQKFSMDCIQLDNMLVRASGPTLPAGYQRWATALNGNVGTLMPYRPGSSGSENVFALTDAHKLYDCTTRMNTVTLPPLTATLGAGADAGTASHTQFTGVAANYLAFVYRGDGYYTYDTSGGLVNRTASVTGFNAALASFVGVWKRRLMFVEYGTTKFWYLPVDAIQGAATVFDVGALLAHGGSLVAFANWTYDGGAGIEDHLVLFGSRGDVLVYSGSNIATDAVLRGQWFAGSPPAGERFFTQYGGDVKFLTEFGIQEISVVTSQRQSDPSKKLSANKQQQFIAQQVSATPTGKFWEMHLHGQQEHLLIVTPNSYWHANNITIGGFSRLTWTPSKTATIGPSGYLYAASGANVYRMFSGDTDDETLVGTTATPGTTKEGSLTTFFVNVDGSANKKRLAMVKLTTLSAAKPDVSAILATEFDADIVLPAYEDSSFVASSTATLWGGSTWGGGTWSASSSARFEHMFGAAGFGVYAALYAKMRGLPGSVLTDWSPAVERGKWI